MRAPTTTLALVVALAALSLACDSPAVTASPTPAANQNVLLRRVAASVTFQGKPAVEVEVRSAARPFPARAEIPILRIGRSEFMLSRYPDSGEMTGLIFMLTPEEFAGTSNGDPITLQYGRSGGPSAWDFGVLDKSKLR